MKQINKINSILEFSLAEFGSAVEMLQASKFSQSSSLRIGFIHHALDEYGHARQFLKIAKNIAKRSGVDGLHTLTARNLIDKKIVDPAGFLIEKLSFERFCVFVFINETFAMRYFAKRIIADGILSEAERNEIELIAEDEERHIYYAGRFVTALQKEKAVQTRTLLWLERLFLIKRNLQTRLTTFNRVISTLIISFSIPVFYLFMASIRLSRSFEPDLGAALKDNQRLF